MVTSVSPLTPTSGYHPDDVLLIQDADGPRTLSFVIRGRAFSIHRSHPNFEAAHALIGAPHGTDDDLHDLLVESAAQARLRILRENLDPGAFRKPGAMALTGAVGTQALSWIQHPTEETPRYLRMLNQLLEKNENLVCRIVEFVTDPSHDVHLTEDIELTGWVPVNDEGRSITNQDAFVNDQPHISALPHTEGDVITKPLSQLRLDPMTSPLRVGTMTAPRHAANSHVAEVTVRVTDLIDENPDPRQFTTVRYQVLRIVPAQEIAPRE